MRILFGVMAAVAAVALLTSGSAKADGSQEIADLQARIATLEAKMMAPAGGGDAEALTSLRKKGAVKIGGDIELDYRSITRDEGADTPVNAATVNNGNNQDNNWQDNYTVNQYVNSDIDLDIRVDAGTDSYLFIKLDLDDTGVDMDLPEEVKFVWENIKGTGFGVVFGKAEVPFGQDKDRGIMDPYVHGAFWQAAGSALVSAAGGRNMASVMMDGVYSGSDVGWVGEIDNSYLTQVSYKYKELATLELAAFVSQPNMNGTMVGNQNGTDVEDRVVDNGFQSWVSRLTVTPLEGLKLSGSFLNVHDDSMADDSTENDFIWGDWDGRFRTIMNQNVQDRLTAMGTTTEANRQAVYLTNGAVGTGGSIGRWSANRCQDIIAASFAADYVTPDKKWNIYAEYIHNWNVGWFKDLDADIFNAGVAYSITPKLSLIGQYGYVGYNNNILNDSIINLSFEEDLHSGAIAAEYQLDNGIRFLVEYMHEWYACTIDGWDSSEADVVSGRVAWKF